MRRTGPIWPLGRTVVVGREGRERPERHSQRVVRVAATDNGTCAGLAGSSNDLNCSYQTHITQRSVHATHPASPYSIASRPVLHSVALPSVAPRRAAVRPRTNPRSASRDSPPLCSTTSMQIRSQTQAYTQRACDPAHALVYACKSGLDVAGDDPPRTSWRVLLAAGSDSMAYAGSCRPRQIGLNRGAHSRGRYVALIEPKP